MTPVHHKSIGRIVVLASGSGSNLQAIMEAIDEGIIQNASIVLVISNNSQAMALTRARRRGIPTRVFRSKNYSSAENRDRDIVKTLIDYKVNLVVLAGYMKILTPVFIQAFENRILNLHPALLPSFPGEHGIEDALNYGVKISGCTVHFVDEGIDTGPIIRQEAVPVYPEDTVESLRQRIQAVEHRIYPEVINLLVQGKIIINGRRCLIEQK